MNHIRAVLFDLDGTLIDSAPDLAGAVDRMRTDRGLSSLPLSTYRPMVGSGARGMLQVAFGMAPDAPEFEAMKEEFLNNYQHALDVHTRAFDGVFELLAGLQARGLIWGVVTNKHERFTHRIVERMTWLQAAATVICGDTTPHAKPHPEPLLEASRRIAVPPEHCVYVGDDERDIQAGRAAGMTTVAALYGYLGLAEPAHQWGADHVIDLPLSLLKCFEAP